VSRLTTAGYRVGWAVVRVLPAGVVGAVAQRMADRATDKDGRGVQRLRANLRRVRPGITDAELAELTRQAMRSYARYWVEVFRLPAMRPDDVVSRTSVTGEHHLRDPLAAGRGVICALPHMGNWDTAGAWATYTGSPVTTVAERLRPEELFELFLHFRQSIGMTVLPADGGRTTIAGLARELRGGGLVALVADRDLSAHGIPVTMFGEATSFPAGPAALAESTGADLVPVTLWFTERGWHLHLHPPIAGIGAQRHPSADKDAAIREITQELADTFAAGISEHPADWHMLQPFFLADRPQRS
jgi:phosphatidylinositol dimannoside acyltransferase